MLERAAMLTEIDSNNIKEPFYNRAYIGETLSCIYLPLYIENDILHDGVTNKPLGSGDFTEKIRKNISCCRDTWSSRFIAALCPQCGDSLRGEHDSLVLSCYNCHSSWVERQEKFYPIAWNCVISKNKANIYLPFWKILLRSSGLAMTTFADFLRVTNQPLVISKKHKKMELVFWVPAFKLRPSTFLSLGKNITLRQAKIPPGDSTTMVKKIHPVTLQRKEAVQALKSIKAGAALNKRKLLPLLPAISFHYLSTELTYLPFVDQ